MFGLVSILSPLFAAASTNLASSQVTAPAYSKNSGNFLMDLLTELLSDDSMWEAVTEGILALIVFGIASAAIQAYKKKKSKGLREAKAKLNSGVQMPLPQDATKTERCSTSAPVAGGSSDAAALLKQSPWRSKSTAALAARPRPPPGLPASNSATRTPAKASETNALANAVKEGMASDLPRLLDAALARSLATTSIAPEEVATLLLHSSLRACAAARCFDEALAAYDHMAARIGDGSLGLWSVLLYSTVESGAFGHCKLIFQNLCKQGAPSGHDFVNMVRCYAGQKDPEGLRDMLNTLRITGHSVDACFWNRAVAACGNSEDALENAEALATAGICSEGLDAVGYNTLMKINARAGRLSRCFELRSEMLSKGIEASEVTFGILLDVCVGAKELDHARKVFEELCTSGLRLNVVHCTTFIKGLVSVGQLNEASRVLKEMEHTSGVKPDLIAYSTIVKAYADSGEVSGAMDMVEQMLAEKVRPDEIIYNSVLTGCCTFPRTSAQVMRTFEKLVTIGMRPTTTALSILLKGLAHSDAWTMSLQVLSDAPQNFRLEPELRLYAQLAQACVKSRSFGTVVEVFEAMLETAGRRHETVDPVIAGRFLRSCLLGGMPEMAEKLRAKAHKAGIVVDPQVEKMLRSAMAKQARPYRPKAF